MFGQKIRVRKVTLKINGDEVKRPRKMKNLGAYIAETLNKLSSSHLTKKNKYQPKKAHKKSNS